MPNQDPKSAYSIFCEDLTISYAQRDILKIPHLSLQSGDILLIEGPSGSGKSSFLSLLAGLYTSQSGSLEYTYAGKSLSSRDLDFGLFRTRCISLTFSEPLFFEDLSVEENIFFPYIFHLKAYEDSWKERLFDMLEINNLLSHPVFRISSGERDRVNIIRALLYDDPIVLLDEPGTHLDDRLYASLLTILEEYRERVSPIMAIVSHDSNFQFIASLRYSSHDGILTEKF